MESTTIYNESYNEINKLKKQLLAGNSITINFNKLDGDTVNVIRKELAEIFNNRSSEIYSVISNTTSLL